VAISSQATVLVPREAGAESVQEAKRLQPGSLVFRADPQYPKKIGRNEVEIVKLLATVGENGEVTNVQRISGPLPFATAAMSAIREWKYSPTLFDGHPVKTEEKIVVAFRAR
jgi:protein TonB